MKDEAGEQIACANSIWVFMDLEKGRPARPTPEHIEPYGTEAPLDMPYEGRKIELPAESGEREPFPVRKYHIDTNEHVNNCQYVQMALEMLPGDVPVSYTHLGRAAIISVSRQKEKSTMIIINEEKCIGCGLCAKDCPAARIRVDEGKAVWSCLLYTSRCV